MCKSLVCETVSHALAISIHIRCRKIVFDPYSAGPIYLCNLVAAAPIGGSAFHKTVLSICGKIMSMHVVSYAIGYDAFEQTTNSWYDANGTVI